MAWPDREREYKNMRAVQLHLGEISMAWSSLDRRVDDLICDLLDISFAETAAIVSGLLLPKKAQMALRLIAIDNPGAEWAGQMNLLLVELSGRLAEERNRLIHDAWQFDMDAIRRIDSTARRSKGPDGSTELSFDRHTDVTIHDLKKWVARAAAINFRLRELRPALLPWLLGKREAASSRDSTGAI